ncbi:G protein pathway suppressor 2 [Biomphalaria glabrata]|nr:G protein pathway suppressor 2-like [Biomphalaria glabrata]
MPALLERPKMTRAMYEALKRHIMREREKKKQEQEQDAMMERLKKERELKKKKEEEDSLTLEETNEQILQLEKKLEILKGQKHDLFSQLKKVLHQEGETRRRAQQKEQSEMTLSQPSYQHASLAPAPQPVMMHGRPALYKPTAPTPILTGIKRPRSPSPTAVSASFSGYNHSEPKYPHTTDPKYTHGDTKYVTHPENKFSHADAKYLAPYTAPKAAPTHLYATNHPPAAEYKNSAYQQAGTSHLFPTNQSFQQQQGAGGSYPSTQPSSNKYPGPNASAFSSYQNQFSQKTIAEQFTGYPIQRMQQPAYHTIIQQQQSLDHGSQKQPAFEDKYKLSQSTIRGMVPPQQQALTQAIQLQQQQQQQQQQQAKEGAVNMKIFATQQSSASFVSGYPARSQAAPPPVNYPTSTNASTYATQAAAQGRPSYGGQPHSRFF